MSCNEFRSFKDNFAKSKQWSSQSFGNQSIEWHLENPSLRPYFQYPLAPKPLDLCPHHTIDPPPHHPLDPWPRQPPDTPTPPLDTSRQPTLPSQPLDCWNTGYMLFSSDTILRFHAPRDQGLNWMEKYLHSRQTFQSSFLVMYKCLHFTSRSTFTFCGNIYETNQFKIQIPTFVIVLFI